MQSTQPCTPIKRATQALAIDGDDLSGGYVTNGLNPEGKRRHRNLSTSVLQTDYADSLTPSIEDYANAMTRLRWEASGVPGHSKMPKGNPVGFWSERLSRSMNLTASALFVMCPIGIAYVLPVSTGYRNWKVCAIDGVN